jgi:hypothetical protein
MIDLISHWKIEFYEPWDYCSFATLLYCWVIPSDTHASLCRHWSLAVTVARPTLSHPLQGQKVNQSRNQQEAGSKQSSPWLNVWFCSCKWYISPKCRPFPYYAVLQPRRPYSLWSLQRSRRRRKDNFETNHTEIGWLFVKWTEMLQDWVFGI